MMSENICLTDLKRGQKAVIAKLAAYDDMRRRLQDIGIIEGTTVECLGKSPLGDPTAFLIRGAVIALRSEDSGRVLVQSKIEEKANRHYGEEMVAANLSLED
ncbi:FeoA family protein [Lacrimispora sp.]|uniref:FeoA family protein n=1 Tax=Lacrimispora sp. TaxID=2719234 RepID=UPI0028B13766|nr:FeoA family protein [Lacrimispora sp.]